MPVFEYYDFENYILCYYYPYMTLACQGGAFLTGVLYRCGKIKLFCIFNVTCFFVSFLNYRYWNLLGTMMAGLCLPVDVLIFYKEKFFLKKHYESWIFPCLMPKSRNHWEWLGLLFSLHGALYLSASWFLMLPSQRSRQPFWEKVKTNFPRKLIFWHLLQFQMVNWELF